MIYKKCSLSTSVSEKTNSTINRNSFNEKLYELRLGLIVILFQCRCF